MQEFTKEMDTEVKTIAEGVMELCVDADHISITTHRFEELVRAETELNLLRRAHHADLGYRMDAILDVVLGPKDEPEEGGGNS